MAFSHVRERSLTALVIVEGIELFVLAPFSAVGHAPFPIVLSLIGINIAAVLATVWPNRIAIGAVVLATAVEIGAVAVRGLHPSARTETLDFAAAFVLLVALTVVLALTVFGPGRVSVHRILGAVAIYLNAGAAFALAFRMIDSLGPQNFSTTIAAAPANHSIADFIYFSFATLTTAGFGDIVPVNAFARSLANVESVIGALFPATLLARLMTLHLEDRRTERPRGDVD